MQETNFYTYIWSVIKNNSVMKHYINILLAVFLTASLSNANTTNQADYTFTIHLGAFVKAKVTDFEDIRPYGYMYAHKLNNLHQIYMGDYETEGAAIKVLDKIKIKGYPDAFVTRRSLASGSNKTTIEIGSQEVGKNINWANYSNVGPLQTFQSGNFIIIVTGPFNSQDEAQGRLTHIQNSGYKNAGIQIINSALLHKVGDFETGGGIQIPTSFERIVVPPAPEEEVVIAEIPPKKKSMNMMVKKKTPAKKVDPRDEPRPSTYGDDVLTAKSPTARIKTKPKVESAKATESVATKTKPATKTETKAKKKIEKKIFVEKTLATPTIRPKVKRTSVLKLQEVLKLKGDYKSGLDGFYGKGTNASYKNMITKNKEIQKYKWLAKMYKEEAGETSTLEQIIFTMNDDVAAGVSRLKNEKSAISKAYQAYGIYALSGKNKTTDKLMNEAIKESFSNNKMKNKAPFDYKAKQSYSNYAELIKHIRYIHGASKEGVAVPCWMFEKHEKEAVAAFDPANELASSDYVLQDCGNVMAWESLSLIETIMKEMTPDLTAKEKQEVAKMQSKRASLMLSPKAQSVEAYKNIDNWNKNLWSGLAKWEAADPLHAKIMTPLKVTYFQSWALLEDHFMNKGFETKEARGLSLCVMQSIVDPYLSRYSDK